MNTNSHPEQDPPPTNYACNCRNRSEWSLDNKCLTTNIVYKVIVSATNKPGKNTSECLNFLSKTVIETRRDILDTKNT